MMRTLVWRLFGRPDAYTVTTPQEREALRRKRAELSARLDQKALEVEIDMAYDESVGKGASWP